MHGTGFGATAAADAFGGIHAGQGAAPAEEAVEQPVARKKTLLAHNGIRQAKGRAGGDESIARQHGRLLHQPPPAGRPHGGRHVAPKAHEEGSLLIQRIG